MSEPPEKENQGPWAKYYAERGTTRPPMAGLTRSPLPPGAKPAPKKSAAGGAAKKTEISAELAAAVDAVKAAAPGATAAPFISAMQKEARAREQRRAHRLAVAKLVAKVVAVAVALALFATFGFNREPDDELLEARAQEVGDQVLALMSSNDQPLQLTATATRLVERFNISHRRYEAVVTLQLRKALYLPAHTNGTEAYRQLQRTLDEAHARALKFRLFDQAVPKLEPPDMPALLQLSYHAGDPVTVRVPFEARRFGWRWRFDAPEYGVRGANRTFTGLPLDHYASAPTLIFGTPDSMMEVRDKMRLARNYITEVGKAMHYHDIAEAPALGASADTAAVAAPNAPAVLPDPNAPARVGPSAVAQPDPNAVALPDPNAPAVSVPGLKPRPR